jgi:RNA polymerase sigma-70 factor (ECF subfamily)
LTERLSYHVLNEKLFQNYFEEFYQPLCRFASGYVSDRDSVEDIVQQVFVNLWAQRENINTAEPIKSYLFTSVRNRCLNHIRDRKKYNSYFLDVELELEIPVSDRDMFSEAEIERRVAEALSKLPEKCKEVFLLCRNDNLKYKEVAEKLDISVKTVEAQMSKALKILRLELKDFFLILFLWKFFS